MDKLLILLVVIIAGLISIPIQIWYGNREIITIDIQEVSIEIVNSSEWTNRNKYVYSDSAVYTVEDRFWIWYFDSMSTYNELRKNEGKLCSVEVIWKRDWFFSYYRNIVKVLSCK